MKELQRVLTILSVISMTILVMLCFEVNKQKHSYKIAEESIINSNALVMATESVCELKFNQYNIGGTAFIVGRKKSENEFIYYAITAAHVVDDLSAKLKDDPTANRVVHLAFNSWLRGKLEAVSVVTIEVINNDLDWSLISFRLPWPIPCLKLASQNQINQLLPSDPVFQFGAENLEGVIIHRTNIAATTNVLPTPDVDQFDPASTEMVCYKVPLIYLRTAYSTMPGASGGPLLDIHGNVLAIITAKWNNTSLALKVNVITTQMGASEFFVEGN